MPSYLAAAGCPFVFDNRRALRVWRNQVDSVLALISLYMCVGARS
jgi:hypothetical protein